MTDENNAADTAAESGELIRRGEAPPPAPARTAKHRTVDWLLSRLSRWPFSNRLYVKSLKTAQEVIQERTKLEEAIIGHGRTRGRLNDLGLTLEQEHLQRLREFFEEEKRFTEVINDSKVELEMMKKKNKMKKEELTIEEIEQKKRLLKAKKELEELQQPPPPPPPPPPPRPRGRGRSEKMKLRERAYKRYDRETQRIEAMTVTAQRKTVLKRAATNDLEEEIERIDRMP